MPSAAILILALLPVSAIAQVDLPDGVSAAQVDHVMQNTTEWRQSAFPFGQKPNGCGPKSLETIVRDNWGRANFSAACNDHDRCYWTLGSEWQDCNTSFRTLLRKACQDAYNRNHPSRPLCLSVAETYYQAVQAGVSLGFFERSQTKQLEYEEAVWDLMPTIENLPLYFSHLNAT